MKIEMNSDKIFTLDGRIFVPGGSVSWFPQRLKTAKVIFDIGSFDCADALLFKEAYPGADVYAFEGCPYRAKIIQEYINDYSIVFSHMVITNKTGEVDFYSARNEGVGRGGTGMGEYDAQGSIYRQSDKYKQRFGHIKQDDKPNKVPAMRIDDFCKENNIKHIDIVHSDVEGSEWELVESLGDMRPSLLLLEFLRDDYWVGQKGNYKELTSLLQKMDYHLIEDGTQNKLFQYKKGETV